MGLMDGVYWERDNPPEVTEALRNGVYWDIDDSSDKDETEQQGAFISSFDDLVDHVHKMSLKDQKDLAEGIIRGFIEGGWHITGDCIADDGSFNLSKTETL